MFLKLPRLFTSRSSRSSASSQSSSSSSGRNSTDSSYLATPATPTSTSLFISTPAPHQHLILDGSATIDLWIENAEDADPFRQVVDSADCDVEDPELERPELQGDDKLEPSKMTWIGRRFTNKRNPQIPEAQLRGYTAVQQKGAACRIEIQNTFGVPELARLVSKARPTMVGMDLPKAATAAATDALGVLFFEHLEPTVTELQVDSLTLAGGFYEAVASYIARCESLCSFSIYGAMFRESFGDKHAWDSRPSNAWHRLAAAIGGSNITQLRINLSRHVTGLDVIAQELSRSKVEHLELELWYGPGVDEFFDNLDLQHLRTLKLGVKRANSYTAVAGFLARCPPLDELKLYFDDWMFSWKETQGLSAFAAARAFSRVRTLHLHHRFMDEDRQHRDVHELLAALDPNSDCSGGHTAPNLEFLHLGDPRAAYKETRDSKGLKLFVQKLRAPRLRHLSVPEQTLALGAGAALAALIRRSPLTAVHTVLSNRHKYELGINTDALIAARSEAEEADLSAVLAAAEDSHTLAELSLYRERTELYKACLPEYTSCLQNREQLAARLEAVQARNQATARRVQTAARLALPVARILLLSRPALGESTIPALPYDVLSRIAHFATQDECALSARQWTRLERYASDRAALWHAAEMDKIAVRGNADAHETLQSQYDIGGTLRQRYPPRTDESLRSVYPWARWMPVRDGFMAAHGWDSWESNPREGEEDEEVEAQAEEGEDEGEEEAVTASRKVPQFTPLVDEEPQQLGQWTRWRPAPDPGMYTPSGLDNSTQHGYQFYR